MHFANILEGALKLASTRQWQVILFIDKAAEEPFASQDKAFYESSPDLFELLLQTALRQKDEFFTVIP